MRRVYRSAVALWHLAIWWTPELWFIAKTRPTGGRGSKNSPNSHARCLDLICSSPDPTQPPARLWGCSEPHLLPAPQHRSASGPDLLPVAGCLGYSQDVGESRLLLCNLQTFISYLLQRTQLDGRSELVLCFCPCHPAWSRAERERTQRPPPAA